MRTCTVLPAMLIVAMTCCYLEPAGAEEGMSNRPNVVLIITDDQGYGDLSAHGNPYIKTPNLDKLATQSVRLDDYHASPYCVPSRAALLTGRYADRTGIHNVEAPDWIARADEFMMGTSFENAGYATGMFGKWHLGDNYPFGPEYRDFDEVLRHYGGAVGVLADYWDNCYLDDTYYQNGKPTKVDGYCTDVFFSAAKQFIAKSVEEEKPFFVYLPTNAPHGPRICPPSYAAPYKQGKTAPLATFYGMIANIDENVGKLRAYLQDQGLAENTIFIFTTDNGTAGGGRLFNAGMKGSKGSTYDGGHRVPFFLHWPAGGFDKQRRVETLTAHIDVFPTLLDLCGLEKPVGVEMDGVSLHALLEKGDHPDWPDRIIMTDNQKKELPTKWATTAVMSERWRLIDGKELYDIDADPGQRNNIIEQHPQVVERLSAWYDDLWTELEPTFRVVPEIPLGDQAIGTVALNYHDCIGRHKFWFQNSIRSLISGRFRGKPVSMIDSPQRNRPPAYWPVDVQADGEYRIELRRWPAELDRPIHADLPAGAPVYGEPSHRSTPGVGFPAVRAILKIDEERLSTSVDETTKAAVFQAKLTSGSHRISAKFHAADGRSLDAFYVYVTKVANDQTSESTKPDNPNIVLIMADDLGWGDVSCYSPRSPIQTPHIDRLAKEGIRLTNAHAPAAACTPTRYGLLTGRYPWRSYVKKKVLRFYAPAMITKDHVTIPSFLKSHNYRTAGFGKWHTGLDWTPIEGDPVNWRSHWNSDARNAAVTVGRGIDHGKPFGNAPTDVGFDTYFGTPSNASRLPFFIEDNWVAGNPKPDGKGLMRDPTLARDTVDDVYVAKAIRFIKSHQKDHPDRPFFVYLPVNAIHGAVDVPKRFQGETRMTIREDKIPWVNESVGKVLDALDDRDLANNTLVVFTSDNGPLNSPVARANGHQPTGPYRGVKSNVYDGGTRVPFLARWPGHIPAGTTSDQLACLTDMLATVAELCQTPLRREDHPDSFSLLSTLQQKNGETARDNLVTLSYGGFLTIRQGRWKAVFGTKWTGGHPTPKYGGERPKTVPPNSPEIGQLFDISNDPYEKHDVWEEHSEVVQNLRRELGRIKGLIDDDPQNW